MTKNGPITQQRSIFALKFKIILLFLLLFLVLLTVSRAALFWMSPNYFSVVAAKETVLSFLIGVRFDFYVICLFVMPGMALLLLPIAKKKFIAFWSIWFCLLFVAVALFLTADVIFFSIFKNHIGVELFTAFTHGDMFAQLAFQTYWYVTYPLLIGLGVAVFLVGRYCHRATYTVPAKFIQKSLCLVLAVALIAFLGIRSRLILHGKALGIMESQVLGSQQTADLILNGLFTAWHAVRTHEHRPLFFTQEDYAAVPAATRSERIPDPQNPFERERVSFNYENKGYNFVLLVLESFDPILWEKYPQAVPNFMQLRKESLYFKNFYSSGRRSLMGRSSTLFSIPYVWGLPTFTQGLGGKSMSRLASYFNNKGYTTINVMTARATADKANEMADYLGFQQFYAKEDIPVRYKYPAFNKGFDKEGFEFFLEKINQAPGHFFAHLYTSSAHAPYNIVLSQEHMVLPGNNEEEQFVNRSAYVDAAMGDFFQEARRQPWFKNTIFFIIPDHRAAVGNQSQQADKAKQNFGSFLLVYAPALFAPKTVDINANQEDILPTLLDLLNSRERFASSGQSLFDKDRNPVKYIYAENRDIYILGKGHNHWFNFVDNMKDLSEDEKTAVRFNEAIYQLLKENKFKSK